MKREKVRIIDTHYACAFRPEPEGGYTVRCAAFPEIVTHGRTLEEARHNAREAIELCIEVYQAEGRRLPRPENPRRTIREVVPATLSRA